MGKIIISVLPADQGARLKQKYPNPPPEAKPDDVFIPIHDTGKVVEIIKSQPQTPEVVIVTNFYPESEQLSIKAAIEAGAPGVPVAMVPQGLDDEQGYKYLLEEKLKAGK
ncbi:hypothetical protein BY996DRAFT_4587399 [Phakopsora pachyrhizi]|nr:hypothetical protein BY996DRAFT_4587399 [Phakopsora pachyrhizi]